ncbi:MAG TPA: anti-sigma factor [Streptosporangiaceae bacterium]
MRLPRPDLHMLTGVYAVDAVDGAEREAFERHRRRCRPCDNEVASLAATAAALALPAAMPAPAGMRARVLAATSVTRQLPPATERQRLRAMPTARPLAMRLTAGLAAASLAMAVTFVVLQVSTQHRLDTAQAQQRAIAAVLAASDARISSAPTTVGGTATVVVSRAEHELVFGARGLRPLPASKVYELWLIGPPRIRSAGLLPRASAGRVAPLLASGLEAGDKVGVTVEPAGGTSSPTTNPVVLITLPA